MGQKHMERTHVDRTAQLEEAQEKLVESVRNWLSVNGYAGMARLKPLEVTSSEICSCRLDDLFCCGASIPFSECVPATEETMRRRGAVPFRETEAQTRRQALERMRKG